MNRPCVTAGASFLDAFKGLCYVPDMQKVRQPAGTALMILAFPAAIYGAFPWGIALGAFLFLLGVVVAAQPFFRHSLVMVPVFPGDVSGGSFYLDVESGLFFQPFV